MDKGGTRSLVCEEGSSSPSARLGVGRWYAWTACYVTAR